jgi:hypothetical protein
VPARPRSPRRPHDVPPPTRRSRVTRRTLAWSAALLTAALGATLTAVLTNAFNSGVSRVSGHGSAPPFAWTVRIDRNQCEGASRYLALPSLPPRPDSAPFGLPDRVRATAPEGVYSDVTVTFQGKTDTATVLQAIHVQVVSRARPTGAMVEFISGCGGVLPRYFAVDLDRRHPGAMPSPGRTLGLDGPSPIPAVPFPFRISSTDPEVFHIMAATRTCDCRWRVTVDWTSGARSGTVTIDDHGHPFRTVGAQGVPVYATAGAGWTRRPAPDYVPVR